MYTPKNNKYMTADGYEVGWTDNVWIHSHGLLRNISVRSLLRDQRTGALSRAYKEKANAIAAVRSGNLGTDH